MDATPSVSPRHQRKRRRSSMLKAELELSAPALALDAKIKLKRRKSDEENLRSSAEKNILPARTPLKKTDGNRRLSAAHLRGSKPMSPAVKHGHLSLSHKSVTDSLLRTNEQLFEELSHVQAIYVASQRESEAQAASSAATIKQLQRELDGLRLQLTGTKDLPQDTTGERMHVPASVTKATGASTLVDPSVTHAAGPAFQPQVHGLFPPPHQQQQQPASDGACGDGEMGGASGPSGFAAALQQADDHNTLMVLRRELERADAVIAKMEVELAQLRPLRAINEELRNVNVELCYLYKLSQGCDPHPEADGSHPGLRAGDSARAHDAVLALDDLVGAHDDVAGAHGDNLGGALGGMAHGPLDEGDSSAGGEGDGHGEEDEDDGGGECGRGNDQGQPRDGSPGGEGGRRSRGSRRGGGGGGEANAHAEDAVAGAGGGDARGGRGSGGGVGGRQHQGSDNLVADMHVSEGTAPHAARVDDSSARWDHGVVVEACPGGGGKQSSGAPSGVLRDIVNVEEIVHKSKAVGGSPRVAIAAADMRVAVAAGVSHALSLSLSPGAEASNETKRGRAIPVPAASTLRAGMDAHLGADEALSPRPVAATTYVKVDIPDISPIGKPSSPSPPAGGPPHDPMGGSQRQFKDDAGSGHHGGSMVECHEELVLSSEDRGVTSSASSLCGCPHKQPSRGKRGKDGGKGDGAITGTPHERLSPWGDRSTSGAESNVSSSKPAHHHHHHHHHQQSHHAGLRQLLEQDRDILPVECQYLGHGIHVQVHGGRQQQQQDEAEVDKERLGDAGGGVVGVAMRSFGSLGDGHEGAQDTTSLSVPDGYEEYQLAEANKALMEQSLGVAHRLNKYIQSFLNSCNPPNRDAYLALSSRLESIASMNQHANAPH